MKFKGREVPATRLFNTSVRFLKFLPDLRIAKSPFKLLKHYVKQTSPEVIELRNGVRIILSSHPHDIMTFFGVFLRKDYGIIKPGSIVIDIGANIGMFSLYAALSGAEKVYAFEPSQEAFQILLLNIQMNNLEGKIIPINKAVSDQDNLKIKFPIVSSPYNMINGVVNADQEFCEIETITLGKFIVDYDIDQVNLLKLDCEGAEFDILPSLDENSISKINDIRMEYHGDPAPLIAYLNQFEYTTSINKDVTILMCNRQINMYV
jgi:FkbM family methyltransferase